MNEQFDDVLEAGYVSVSEPMSTSMIHDRGGRAAIYVQDERECASVVISAKDARKLAETLIQIAEANGV